eukprot:3844856-Pleurochrysis_carterae.AAC.1
MAEEVRWRRECGDQASLSRACANMARLMPRIGSVRSAGTAAAPVAAAPVAPAAPIAPAATGVWAVGAAAACGAGVTGAATGAVAGALVGAAMGCAVLAWSSPLMTLRTSSFVTRPSRPVPTTVARSSLYRLAIAR